MKPTHRITAEMKIRSIESALGVARRILVCNQSFLFSTSNSEEITSADFISAAVEIDAAMKNMKAILEISRREGAILLKEEEMAEESPEL